MMFIQIASEFSLLHCTYLLKVCSASSGAEIGKISKQWGGFIKEIHSDADTFFVICPPDLDVKIKAVLLGAALLIVRSHSFIHENDNFF
jgi:hypothetical protein